MRVLFTAPEKYNEVLEWYERLNDTQKHRKVCDIFDDPTTFKERFNLDRHGAQYTMFYFDKSLPASFIITCFMNFVILYGEETAKYIAENKMRTIDINRLLQINVFDCFSQLVLEQDIINDAIYAIRKPFICRNLL